MFFGQAREALTGTFAGAQVELNPHQVDAALFAFRSPLSKGALVPDSFASSGTTGAVAHKMNHRWIRIELGNH